MYLKDKDHNHQKKMKPKFGWLALKNVFFVLLQPGTVVVLIPYMIVKPSTLWAYGGDYFMPHFIALLLFMVGFLVLLACVIHFIKRGYGTISPAIPTKRLVISGPYRYSRNPMYVAVLTMLLAMCILTRSMPLMLYTLGVFAVFYTFVRCFEEPRLHKDFGANYNSYCLKVGRWW